MRRTSGHERYVWLRRAAELLTARAEPFAELLSREEGKVLTEARFEVSRAIQTLEISAEEARRITGRGIPLDGSPGGAGKLGFTLRVPCGVVVAITPFNFPLNLVVHKVGPALAAGNAVILKPATDTPLSALRLVELLWEAGVPADALSCLTGGGADLSEALCSDPRVRKISFTGSHAVGEKICRIAGVKRVTMELGSNAPLIVMDDADLAKVIDATVATGYSNAGQVCISTQRVLVAEKVYGDFLSGLGPKVEAIRTGDPLAEGMQMGPMIRAADAIRVESWLHEAVADGARLLTGGFRDGAMLRPGGGAELRSEPQRCDSWPTMAVENIDHRRSHQDRCVRQASDAQRGDSVRPVRDKPLG